VNPDKRFQRWLTAPLVILASLLIWIEETLWIGLKWLMARIAVLSWVRRIEAFIQRLPPYATIVVFFFPLVLLLPVKLIAVYWLARGYWFVSLAVIIAAKVLGTAIEARMFVLCKPQLMTIPWFRRLHDTLIAIRDRVHAALHALPVYQYVRAQLNAIKLKAKQLMMKLRTRFHSFRNWYRRNKVN
jgi:hypothetical protein